MEDIYIALYHANTMLKALITLLSQEACVVLHIYSFLICSLEHTVPLAVDYTRSGYYHAQYKLTLCQVPNLITWVGEMCGQRYKPLITLSFRVSSANCQLFATSRTRNPHPQDYQTDALGHYAT